MFVIKWWCMDINIWFACVHAIMLGMDMRRAARYWKGVLWSPSYFAASAGGAPLERVKQYVEAQRAETE